MTYSLNKTIATVDENGTVTGVSPGELWLTAQLTQGEKAVRTAKIRVVVCRKVAKVVLDTKGLQIYEPDDENIVPLLQRGSADEPLTDRILVLPAGKKFWPRATVLPEDVANAHKKVTFETSDPTILLLSRDGQFIASQPGECVLTVRSKQSPEVTEQFHVLVTQPVKKITISAEGKRSPRKDAAAGSSDFAGERNGSAGGLEQPERKGGHGGRQRPCDRRRAGRCLH